MKSVLMILAFLITTSSVFESADAAPAFAAADIEPAQAAPNLSIQVHCGSVGSPSIILDDSINQDTFIAIAGKSAYLTPFGELAVSGNPLRPVLSLRTKDNIVEPCSSSSDLRQFYQNLVEDSQVLKALSDWNQWVSSRPKACSSAVDSKAYVQPGARKVALVLHGVFSNPQAMEATIRFLLNSGYNVIAPRLSEHFNADIKDMDKADYRNWIQDADQAFALAEEFGPEKVTVVGYSLGGLLGSYLALKNPDKIDRLVLLAPAWRVSSVTQTGLFLGSKFNLNLNDVTRIHASCQTGSGYEPVVGGEQVSALIDSIETSYGNGAEWNDSRSAFAQLKVPTLVLLGTQELAVSWWAISRICAGNSTKNCTRDYVQSGDHFDTSTWVPAAPVIPNANNVSSNILRFLGRNE